MTRTGEAATMAVSSVSGGGAAVAAVSAAGTVVGLSGAGIMSGLSAAGAVVGGGAAAGIVVVTAGGALVGLMDDENLYLYSHLMLRAILNRKTTKKTKPSNVALINSKVVVEKKRKTTRKPKPSNVEGKNNGKEKINTKTPCHHRAG